MNSEVIEMELLLSGRLDRPILDLITAEVHKILKGSGVDVKNVTKTDIDDLRGEK